MPKKDNEKVKQDVVTVSQHPDLTRQVNETLGKIKKSNGKAPAFSLFIRKLEENYLKRPDWQKVIREEFEKG